MAANQPPTRPWFRLPSVVRPAPAPAPTPAPLPQPRPFLARPAFRPIGPPQPPPPQPQEPAPPPSAVILAPPVPSLPPPAASFETATAPPPPAAREVNGTASVPGSPISRAPAASLPSSPARPSVVLPPAATASTVSSPVKSSVPAGTSSVPSSPALKLVPTSSSVPSSPAPRPAPSSSVPTSPVAKPAPITSSVPSSPVRASSPRTILVPAVQTPPQSPKSKPTAPPPSPLTLPPSQIKSDAELEPKIPLEAEQKTVVVQKTIGKSTGWPWFKSSDLDRNLADSRKEEHLKEIEKRGSKGHGKKISSDSEEAGMRVLTIAGENKGASMEIFHSPKKNAFEGNSHHLHKKGNPKTDGHEWGNHSSSSRSGSDEEKNPNVSKDKNHKGTAVNAPPMSAFMNSNVQGVNNSIVFQSSCTHHDPGVHLSLSRKPTAAAAGGFNVKDRGGNGRQS